MDSRHTAAESGRVRANHCEPGCECRERHRGHNCVRAGRHQRLAIPRSALHVDGREVVGVDVARRQRAFNEEVRVLRDREPAWLAAVTNLVTPTFCQLKGVNVHVVMQNFAVRVVELCPSSTRALLALCKRVAHHSHKQRQRDRSNSQIRHGTPASLATSRTSRDPPLAAADSRWLAARPKLERPCHRGAKGNTSFQTTRCSGLL
mmetsp:Transcript_23311/g.81246  ORF Transcript_23311/g.81246 Transcript_23311/m.81246 type:complete len:205 (+) Transcript_23311:1164-1778(+)